MTVTQLDSLTGEFPNCMFAAMADISSGIVLSSSVNQRQRQEKLDQYCALAKLLFDSDLSREIAKQIATTDQPASLCESQIVNETSVVLFFQSHRDPKEVMFCAGSPDIDFDAFLLRSRAVAEGLSLE